MEQQKTGGLKKYLSGKDFTPLFLLLLVIFSYGLFAPSIGFIMDDMYVIWFQHVFGAGEFPAYFSIDRPLMGYFFTAASFLLGGSESPLTWQLFALIMRWLVSWALWSMLNAIWPQRKRQNTWVAMLSTVYPGFTMHWIAVSFSYFYACLAGFFFSITLMLTALRNRRLFWFLYPLSLMIGLYSAVSAEFYIGLEIIRGAVLWIEASATENHLRQRLKVLFKYWCPFLIGWIFYVIWRVFFFVSANHQITVFDTFQSDFFSALSSLFLQIGRTFYQAVIVSWGNPFIPASYPKSENSLFIITGVMILIFIAFSFWLRRTQKSDGKEFPQTNKETKEALWISLLALVIPLLPFWSAGLSPSAQYPTSRWMLAFLFGSCLFIVAVLEVVKFPLKIALFLIALLVCAGAGYQLAQSIKYRNVWQQQVDFYWQITWRIPGLQPGTTLAAWTLPKASFASGNAITAELNWTYTGSLSDRTIPYQFVLLETPQIEDLPSFTKGEPFEIAFRTYQFVGNTSKFITLAYDRNGCLRVLDEDLNPPRIVLRDANASLLEAAELTDLSMILPSDGTTQHPPTIVLGKEPVHSWCYYFEKAEAARQFGEYGEVLRLLEEARQNGFSPTLASEWYPFIDAYARVNEWETAVELSNLLIEQKDPMIEDGLCHIWSALAADGLGRDNRSGRAINAINFKLGCY